METLAELKRRYDHYALKAERLCEIDPNSEECRKAQTAARAAYRRYVDKADSVDYD